MVASWWRVDRGDPLHYTGWMPVGSAALWIRAWTGAVARPAWRRAAAVWGALGLVASIVMGPTAVTPRDVVALGDDQLGAALALAAIWIALMVPVARLLVRPPGGAYLRTLPAPRGAALLPVAALGLFHAPVLLLFAAGGPAGRALVVWLVLVAAAWIAGSIRAPALAPRPVAWRTPGQALRRLLAARLLADDAVTRTLGFALLAGGGSGMLVRNNGLTGAAATTTGVGVLAILAMPALASTTAAIGVAHRRLWPVCAWTGVPRATWLGAGAIVSAAAGAASAGTAGLVAAAIARLGGVDAARLVGVAVLAGAAMGAGGARVAIWATRGDRVPERILFGCLAIGAVTAGAVFALGELGAAIGLGLALASIVRVQLGAEDP